MRLSKLGRLTVAVLLVGLCGSTVFAQSALRWKLDKGQQLDVQFVQTTKTISLVNAKPITISIDMEMDMRWVVAEVTEAGVASITQTLTRLQTDMKAGEAIGLHYDSSEDKPLTSATEGIAATVKLLINSKTQLQMDARGKILAVDFKSLAGEETAVTNPAVAQLFTKDGIKKLLGQAAAVLPEESLTEDFSWKQARQFASPLGTVKQEMTFEYAGSTDRNGVKVEQIDIVGQLALADPKQSETKLKEYSLTGTTYFDNVNGRLQETELKQFLESEKRYRDRLVRLKATTTTVLTLKLVE